MSEPDEFDLLSIIKVEPEEFEINNQATSHSAESLRDSVENLTRKGNEGKRARESHLENVHCRTEKMTCDHCPKLFFTKSVIRSHVKAYGTKKFECNVCEYKTADKRSLATHEGTHAVKTECPVCKKQVVSSERHLKWHRAEVTCAICQQSICKYNLKRHMKIHRIQKCETCDKLFNNKEDLRR